MAKSRISPRWRGGRAGALCVALATLLTMVAAGPSSGATPSFVFYAAIGSCFSIELAPDTLTTIIWRSADGTLKGRTQQTSSAHGYVSGGGLCTDRWVVARDRLTAKTVDGSRTFVVPDLTVAFDRVSYRVSGHGPAGSLLDIVVAVPQLSGPGRPSFECQTTVRVRSNGTYSRNVQGIPDDGPDASCPPEYTPSGGDLATVTWTNPRGDRVTRSGHAQAMALEFGRSSVTGWTAAGQKVTIVLKAADGTKLGTGHGRGDVNGAFRAIIRDATGHSVVATTGQHVQVDLAGGYTLVVPDMHFDIILTWTWLTGYCMPSARYQMGARYGPSTAYHSGTTNDVGATDLFVNANVKAGFQAELMCLYPLGDRIQLVG